MKKTIVALVALTLIFGSIGLARAAEQERERIPSPTHIKDFKDIIKKGKDLFGRRFKVKEPVLVRPEATACVKTALDTKDASLKVANTAHAEKMNLAIDARNSCQKAALDKTTAREQWQANKVCVETYKKSTRENLGLLKRAKDASWKTFRSDLKACGQLQKAAGGSTEIEIEDGEDSVQ